MCPFVHLINLILLFLSPILKAESGVGYGVFFKVWYCCIYLSNTWIIPPPLADISVIDTVYCKAGSVGVGGIFWQTHSSHEADKT